MGMDINAPPSISSFVIRFVIDDNSGETPDLTHSLYRGAIRHIQSEEEIHFNSWEDAVAFIRRYVPLETGTSQGET